MGISSVNAWLRIPRLPVAGVSSVALDLRCMASSSGWVSGAMKLQRMEYGVGLKCPSGHHGMEVSWNGGTPKSSMSRWDFPFYPIINHPFLGHSLFWKTPVYSYFFHFSCQVQCVPHADQCPSLHSSSLGQVAQRHHAGSQRSLGDLVRLPFEGLDWILSNINKSWGRMGKGAFTLPTSVFQSFLGHGT